MKLLIDAQRMRADEAEGRRGISTTWGVIWESFVLVFLAELGDRTQFTTIFLATAPAFTFAGLLAGTLLGQALVTWLAVGAAKWIGGRISEKLLPQRRPVPGVRSVLPQAGPGLSHGLRLSPPNHAAAGAFVQLAGLDPAGSGESLRRRCCGLWAVAASPSAGEG